MPVIKRKTPFPYSMTALTKFFRNLIGPRQSAKPANQSVLVQNLPASAGEQPALLASEQAIPEQPAPAPPVDPSAWIVQDEDLRDEAVYAAVADAGTEKHEASISSYFGEQKAARVAASRKAEEKLADARQKHDEAAAGLKKLEDRLEELKDQLAAYTGEPNRFRFYVTGIAVCLLILGFVFWVLWEWSEAYFNNGVWVALGVFLFAVLTLYNRSAALFQPNAVPFDRPQWKIWLEDVGVPAVSAAFMVAWDWEAHHPVLNIAFFLFMTLVFMFPGRTLVSYLFHIRPEWSLWRKGLNQRRRLRQQIKEVAAQCPPQAEKVQVAAKKLEEMQAEWLALPPLEAELEEIDQQCNTRVRLFQTEYQSARAVITQLSRKEFEELERGLRQTSSRPNSL